MTSIGLRPIRPRYSLAFAAAAFMTGLSVIGGASASASPSQTDPEPQVIPLNFDSRIADISDEDLAAQALATLNAPRGWKQAGISYTSDPASDYQVILAEPAEVDALCDPIGTGGRVSCQNSNVVALNANRWRSATSDWDQSLEDYRHYLYNHEVGHLSGQFHPANRCPVPGEPEAVMAQQTKGLEGCTGNAWPLDWEIERAKSDRWCWHRRPTWNLRSAQLTQAADGSLSNRILRSPLPQPLRCQPRRRQTAGPNRYLRRPPLTRPSSQQPRLPQTTLWGRQPKTRRQPQPHKSM